MRKSILGLPLVILGTFAGSATLAGDLTIVGTVPKNYPAVLLSSDSVMFKTLGLRPPDPSSRKSVQKAIDNAKKWLKKEIVAHRQVAKASASGEKPKFEKIYDAVKDDVQKDDPALAGQITSLAEMKLKMSDLEDNVEFLNTALELLEDTKKSDSSDSIESLSRALTTARRIIYSVAAQMPLRMEKLFPGTSPWPQGIPIPIGNGQGKMLDTVGMGTQIANTFVPVISPVPSEEQRVKFEQDSALFLAKTKANMEKKALAMPEEAAKKFIAATSEGVKKGFDHQKEQILTGLQFDISPKATSELGKLDISKDNPGWLTREEIKARGKDAKAHWSTLEKDIESMVQNSDEKLKKFSLKKAMRVMIYDKTKDTSTSAKIDVKDQYGLSWKLKWGDEMQTEVIANRIYMAAGGRFQDLVYTFGPGFSREKGTILIFDPKNTTPETACKSNGQDVVVTNYQTLATCLQNSPYKLKLAPYLLGGGQLGDFDEVLKNVKEALGDNKVNGLETYHFVMFRESMVEFQGDGLIRGGPIALNNQDAEEDRVLKGSALFNMWIANHDVKDDNAKGYLIRDGKNSKGYTYVEAQHDLGMSMGSMTSAGQFNSLSDKFISEPYTFNGKDYRRFTEPIIYLPEAWKKMTYADLAWMAKNILDVTPEDIRWAIEQTNWPEFMRNTALVKLLKRQAQIAEVFGNSKAKTAIDSVVSHYSQEYKLKAQLVGDKVQLTASLGGNSVDTKEVVDATDLNAINEELKNFLFREGKNSVEEVLMRDGAVVACKPSENRLQNALVKYLSPSGYSARFSRVLDHYTVTDFEKTAAVLPEDIGKIGCFLREPRIDEVIEQRN